MITMVIRPAFGCSARFPRPWVQIAHHPHHVGDMRKLERKRKAHARFVALLKARSPYSLGRNRLSEAAKRELPPANSLAPTYLPSNSTYWTLPLVGLPQRSRYHNEALLMSRHQLRMSCRQQAKLERSDSWRTKRPSTAGMEARIQTGALPGVGCADLLDFLYLPFADPDLTAVPVAHRKLAGHE